MKKIRYIIRYLQFLFRANTKFGIHSPFIYQFVTEVLNDRTSYPEFQEIQKTVSKIRRSRKVMEITDFGAASEKRRFKVRFRLLSQISRSACISEKYGRLLFRMVRTYKPAYVLELGTSLGISTMYLAMAHREAKLITVEGCANTAEIAQKNLDQHKLVNVEVKVGEFSRLLDKVLEPLPRLDFVFIDGDHRKESTLNYFEACLRKSHNNTILVFDDIHWSAGMEEAWRQITAHPQVTTTIDLFRLGIVFLKKELSRECFVIHY